MKRENISVAIPVKHTKALDKLFKNRSEGIRIAIAEFLDRRLILEAKIGAFLRGKKKISIDGQEFKIKGVAG